MEPTNEGYPRLPYTRTVPTEDELDREIRRAQADGADSFDLLRRVLAVYTQWATLASRNAEFAAREWGAADVSEETAEHWQYLRNADFVQGTNGDYKWKENAPVGRAIVTSGLPYHARRASEIQNLGVVENWIQQSCSALGATWYVASGWLKLTGGQYACIRVVENSGSSTARTHAECTNRTTWTHISVPFKTHKGTTKLTYRFVLAANMTAALTLPILEKGRRPHPWRLHHLDKGNLVTSMKTAGSASSYGNVTLSRAGAIRLRQVDPRKFVFSNSALATASSTTPNPVSTTGSVGTGTQFARSNHVHPGVRSLRTAGSASAYGRLVFSSSGQGSIRQTTQKFIFAFPKAASATPNAVSTSGAVGTGTLYARQDLRMRGTKAIRVRSLGSASGTVRFSQSSNTTVRISGRTVIVGTTGGGSLDINGLAAADPALGDELPIYKVGVGAGNRKITVEKLGFILTGLVGGRLTLTSGVPVTTSDVTGAGTLYYTPYTHDKIALYDGTRWRMYTFTERALALTVTSGSNYDVFLYDNAGTLTLELSAAWTNDTTRADGLVTQNGVWVKSGAPTRRYLGTIRASGLNVTEDSVTKRFVWNMYNRVPRDLMGFDTTDSWTDAGNGTWSPMNAGAAVWKREFVLGLTVQSIRAIASVYCTAGGMVSIAMDSTSTPSRTKTTFGGTASGNTNNNGVETAHFADYPGIGYHYLQVLENTDSASSETFWGDNAGSIGGGNIGVNSGWHIYWEA